MGNAGRLMFKAIWVIRGAPVAACWGWLAAGGRRAGGGLAAGGGLGLVLGVASSVFCDAPGLLFRSDIA